jgi:hypothetical protein
MPVREIGIIQITDRSPLVEVPDRAGDKGIAATQRTTIRSHCPTVRRERLVRRI